MVAILIGLVFVVALGLRFWASINYAKFFDALPESERNKRINSIMQRGI